MKKSSTQDPADPGAKSSNSKSALSSTESNGSKKTADPDKNVADPGNKSSSSSINFAKNEDPAAKNSNDLAVQGQTGAKQSDVSKANADNRKLPATGEQRGILTAVGAAILAGLGAMIPFRKKSDK